MGQTIYLYNIHAVWAMKDVIFLLCFAFFPIAKKEVKCSYWLLLRTLAVLQLDYPKIPISLDTGK